MSNKKHWAEEIPAWHQPVINRYKAGESADSIAADLGVHRTTIYKCLNWHNVPKHKPKRTGLRRTGIRKPTEGNAQERAAWRLFCF